MSDEQRANLFNRANHFRRLNEFDKALAAYENILNENYSDAEAHWGAVLCRYGIKYPEDPASHKHVPTCHRVQYDSFLSDPDYLAALEHATDGYTRSLYEQEAKAISEIQKNILAISQNAEPFDVFICYKEATDGGSRTKDSTIAQDIYYQLTNEGYKVFFSRITLEDKLGQQYEPYIYAALNSAKVMVVVGTKPEYFNAVWVKNEWSRFLALMKKDRNRLLIPCYRDMDAYDLPEEMSMLQSQDMSKIGFMQDLTRGVKKVLDAAQATEVRPVVHASEQTGGTATPQAAPLLQRAFLMLEDQNWQKADELLEQVLNLDPENAKAYVGKLMAELKLSSEEELINQETSILGNSNYQKAIRFAPEYISIANKIRQSILQDINNYDQKIENLLLSIDSKSSSIEAELSALQSQEQEIVSKTAAGELSFYSALDSLEKTFLINIGLLNQRASELEL